MRSVEEMSLRWLKEDEVRVDDGTPRSLFLLAAHSKLCNTRARVWMRGMDSEHRKPA